MAQGDQTPSREDVGEESTYSTQPLIIVCPPFIKYTYILEIRQISQETPNLNAETASRALCILSQGHFVQSVLSLCKAKVTESSLLTAETCHFLGQI